MNKLEEEVPLIEKTYKELSSLINEQKKATQSSIDSIKKQSQKSVADVEKVISKTPEIINRYERVAALMSSLEAKVDSLISQLNEKANTNDAKRTGDSNNSTEISQRITNLEKKVSILESNGILSKSKVAMNSTLPSSKIFPSSKSRFPKDAFSFTMKNIEDVSGMKPYGIAIEGEVIKAVHWSFLLDEAIPIIIARYGIIISALVNSSYEKIIDYSGDQIPYFTEYLPEDFNKKKYRQIKGTNAHVYYGKAQDVIDVLRIILCDYLGVKPENVEVFYHDK